MSTALTVVYWRDIPAQVVARAGGRGRGRTARRALPDRFQEAIDRAAMRAGLSDSDAYLGEWRRGEATAAGASAGEGGGLEEQADALVRRIESEFTAERLAAFVAAGGRAPIGSGAPGADASPPPAGKPRH